MDTIDLTGDSQNSNVRFAAALRCRGVAQRALRAPLLMAPAALRTQERPAQRAEDLTAQLRRQVLALPCCRALDAQARDAVAGATYAELCAIRDGLVAAHELRAHRAEMASYAAAVALQAQLNREAEVVEANRAAAQGFQDDLEALFAEEERLREAEQQDASEERESLTMSMRDMYCFSVGNADWKRADTPRLQQKLRDAEAQCEQRRPPPDFVQLIREPASRAVVESVTWRYENNGWRAQQRPAVERAFLQVAFISDMHGAHGMLDKYMSMPEIAEADCLCICGDAFEHETGVSKLEHLRPVPERDLAKWLRAQPQRYKIVVSGNRACPRYGYLTFAHRFLRTRYPFRFSQTTCASRCQRRWRCKACPRRGRASRAASTCAPANRHASTCKMRRR